jgi:hypothetical protein
MRRTSSNRLSRSAATAAGDVNGRVGGGEEREVGGRGEGRGGRWVGGGGEKRKVGGRTGTRVSGWRGLREEQSNCLTCSKCSQLTVNPLLLGGDGEGVPTCVCGVQE